MHAYLTVRGKILKFSMDFRSLAIICTRRNAASGIHSEVSDRVMMGRAKSFSVIRYALPKGSGSIGDGEKMYPIGWQGAINRGSALLVGDAKTYCTPGASRWDRGSLVTTESWANEQWLTPSKWTRNWRLVSPTLEYHGEGEWARDHVVKW